MPGRGTTEKTGNDTHAFFLSQNLMDKGIFFRSDRFFFPRPFTIFSRVERERDMENARVEKQWGADLILKRFVLEFSTNILKNARLPDHNETMDAYAFLLNKAHRMKQYLRRINRRHDIVDGTSNDSRKGIDLDDEEATSLGSESVNLAIKMLGHMPPGEEQLAGFGKTVPPPCAIILERMWLQRVPQE